MLLATAQLIHVREHFRDSVVKRLRNLIPELRVVIQGAGKRRRLQQGNVMLLAEFRNVERQEMRAFGHDSGRAHLPFFISQRNREMGGVGHNHIRPG